MRTLEYIKENYKSNCLDNRDLTRLMQFLPESDLPIFGIELKEEYKGKHTPIPFTRENVLAQLEKDVEFGFEKALDKRGISASMMREVVQMWNWVLEEGLEGFGGYPMYGLPLFKATAVKYGFNNPIGEDKGTELKYGSED